MRNALTVTSLSALQFILLMDSGLLADSSKSSADSVLPSLDMLPAGSILTNVEIPRYDEAFRPKSLLEAKKLTVISDDTIHGDAVTISLLQPSGKLAMEVDFIQANYKHTEGLLSSDEATIIRGDQFHAKGQGIITDWQTQQGLLIGPVTTQFLTDNQTSKMNSFSPTTKPSLVAALSGLIFTSQLMADPNELTKEEKQNFRQLTRSQASNYNQLLAKGDEIRMIQTKRDIASNNLLTNFLTRIGQVSLLSQVQTPSPTQEKQPATKPSSKNTQTTQIDCDGGMFFDMETGILCYLKNIRVTGLTKDNFTLNCSQELKVYLEASKLKSARDKSSSKSEKNQDNQSQKDRIKNSLNDIVAIGDVILTGQDSKGQDIEIKAAKAHYNAKKEEVMLEGGKLSIQQGNNIQRIKKPTPNAWIRIDKNGNVSTSKHPFVGIYETNR